MLEKIALSYRGRIYQRNPRWKWTEKKDGSVVVDVEHKGVMARIAQKLGDSAKVTHVSFDEYGSALWKAIDGTRTVAQIISKMEKEFPEVGDEMQERVVNHLRTLEVNKLIKIKRR